MDSLSPDGLAVGTTSLTAEMQRNYGLLRELDSRFHDLKKHLETQFGHAMLDVVQSAKRDRVTSDALILEHSNRIASVQKQCMSVAEEKISLAVHTFELVESLIQQLDADYKGYAEELRRERESSGAASDGWPHDTTSQVYQRKGHATFVDPPEPTYCYCDQVAYGEMIACDNPECKVEWFHFDCVGVRERPKGRWFCMECSSSRRRRGT